MKLPSQMEPLPSEMTGNLKIFNNLRKQSKFMLTLASLCWVLRPGSCLGTLTIWQSENDDYDSLVKFSILF